MTTAVDVVRRFEIHVDSESAVDPAADAIERALEATPRVGKVHRVRRPPVLEVRLEGASSRVAEAMDASVHLPGKGFGHGTAARWRRA